MAHKFGFPQMMSGINPVCTCCNTIVAAGAKKEYVDDHVLHDDCGEKLAIVTAIKSELQPVIAMLPETFFKGTDILEKMERARTISTFTSTWYALCEHLVRAKALLSELFHQAVELLKQIAERSRIKATLTPAMNF